MSRPVRLPGSAAVVVVSPAPGVRRIIRCGWFFPEPDDPLPSPTRVTSSVDGAGRWWASLWKPNRLAGGVTTRWGPAATRHDAVAGLRAYLRSDRHVREERYAAIVKRRDDRRREQER
jgi:hypothetical protein